MKIYTKTGDAGETGLFGGERVGKDAARVDAYGTVDELNASLGWCLVACDGDGEVQAAVRGQLLAVQAWLFEMGAGLATPAGSGGASADALSGAVGELEGWIDAAWGAAPELRTFVLPGGCELGARLHVARTVCRRAERGVVSLSRVEPVDASAVVCLNRLSDWLFAAARWVNHAAGVAEVAWTGKG